MSYGNKTVAELCRVLPAAVTSHASLDLLFLENNLESNQYPGSLQIRSTALVRSLHGRDDRGTALTGLVEYVLEHPNGAQTQRLLKALRIDGFDYSNGRLVPTTPEPAALSPQLSQLETDLHELGFNIAAEHYRQAYESFVSSNWEAANAQTRSFTEDFLIVLGKQKTCFVRTDAGAALQDLKNQEFFDQPEFQMIKGFWQGIQDNGPHHGLSDEQEALFRLHFATSIARYAIYKARI